MESGEYRETSVDPEMWHILAGSIVNMPRENSDVYYFPQGHAEHTLSFVDFGRLPNVPAMIPCRIEGVKCLVNPETDEVYARIRLVPKKEFSFCLNDVESSRLKKYMSFEKTLTQSDANNGGGLSVPRSLAETILPPLDYTANPPVQTIICKDVHGETWKFRHIHRGTPLRHLLTTGWSTFVNQKRLIAGDSIIFIKAENGEDLFIGIRRATKSFRLAGSLDGIATNRNMKVRPESVLEATCLAASSEPFVVEYYPRLNTPEFCVRASLVGAAMRIQWCTGMRFKMALETDETSKVSWFTGTVNSIEVNDPSRWPDSPWKSLQVTWDEPKRLQNIKRVNPWSVYTDTGIPFPPLSLFSEPRKKLRASFDFDFPFDTRFPLPSFSRMPLEANHPLEDVISIGKQGVRQPQTTFSANKTHMGLLPTDLHPYPNAEIASHSNLDDKENVSCNLSIGTTCSKVQEKSKTPQFLLFGQPIFAEEHDHHPNDGTPDATFSRMGVATTTSSPRTRYMSNPKPGIHSDQIVDVVSQGVEDLCRSETFKQRFRRLHNVCENILIMQPLERNPNPSVGSPKDGRLNPSD